MYRVYDRKKGRWIQSNIYLAPNGNVFQMDKTMFKNKEKLVQVSNERYIYHRDLGLTDKNYEMIYEGDIAEFQVAEDKFVIVEIAYVNERASYMAFDFKEDLVYELNEERCKFLEVIGNVFDTPELLSDDYIIIK